MHRHVHLAALHATARVALAATALGCSASSTPSESRGSAAPVSTQPASPYVPGSAVPARGDASAASSHYAQKTADAADVRDARVEGDLTDDACAALVKATYAEAGAFNWWRPSSPPGIGPDGKPASAEVVSCCDQLLRPRADGGLDWDVHGVRAECCAIAGSEVDSHPACTPWGPPMPPAMDTNPGEWVS